MAMDIFTGSDGQDGLYGPMSSMVGEVKTLLNNTILHSLTQTYYQQKAKILTTLSQLLHRPARSCCARSQVSLKLMIIPKIVQLQIKIEIVP